MKSTLIIIRGNSRSGKTTAAKQLQAQLGHGTLLVSQDMVRREMLKVHDRDGNLAIELIGHIAAYGAIHATMLLKGFYTKERYGKMLFDLIEQFDANVHTYYFDIPFEETIRRHKSSSKIAEFGEDALRSWWNPDDYLGVAGEVSLSADMSESDVVNLILEQTIGK
ncbi:LOW QUALITY PROTEIN: kinase [Bacillus sp. JCM 19046]|nr:LOW QUALITY PROTEIN: kinase [Bacillus sp. JCM 19045]GAF18865.1 LOW QUALITY PROTEIN: kinase [Bacillus sp. JCM 19046]